MRSRAEACSVCRRRGPWAVRDDGARYCDRCAEGRMRLLWYALTDTARDAALRNAPP